MKVKDGDLHTQGPRYESSVKTLLPSLWSGRNIPCYIISRMTTQVHLVTSSAFHTQTHTHTHTHIYIYIYITCHNVWFWLLLYVNTNKAKYMYIKQKGAISTLSGKPLKLVDQFTYLSSNIPSTERDINIHFAKSGMLLTACMEVWSIR